MAQNNLELMRTLDDSWNAQDWDTFEKRHSKDTTVFWPGHAEPTRGRDNHKAESVEFFKTFPDNHLINHPYKVEIAQGEWTCTVADFNSAKLMAPKFVAPYRKGGKNDGNDAEAICEAVARPNMRFVPIKSIEQQSDLRSE